MDQVLAQLTVSIRVLFYFEYIYEKEQKKSIRNLKFLQKANNKKANADDYLALLRKFLLCENPRQPVCFFYTFHYVYCMFIRSYFILLTIVWCVHLFC
jgi:hypothetical protein